MVLVPSALDDVDDSAPTMTADPLDELHADRIRSAHQRRPQRPARCQDRQNQRPREHATCAAPHRETSRYDVDLEDPLALGLDRHSNVWIAPVSRGRHTRHLIADRPASRLGP